MLCLMIKWVFHEERKLDCYPDGPNIAGSFGQKTLSSREKLKTFALAGPLGAQKFRGKECFREMFLSDALKLQEY